MVPAACARANGGSRPNCCANGICDRCPIDSKFTIINSLEKFLRPGVFLLAQTQARQVRHANGVAEGLVVRNGTQDHLIRADRIALGANAIFNAAILLRSRFAAPALGRYLHEQLAVVLQVDAPIRNFFGGTSITGLAYHFYHDHDRTDKAAVLIQNFNIPADIRPEKDRWTERITLKLIAEDLPQEKNMVVLAGDEPLIEWHGHSDYGYAGLAHAADNIDRIFPVEPERVRKVWVPTTEAHIQGTTRMGLDPETSVIDPGLRTHEVPNVLCLGAGAFPSCSPANPTLTLSALSLRAGRQVA